MILACTIDITVVGFSLFMKIIENYKNIENHLIF